MLALLLLLLLFLLTPMLFLNLLFYPLFRSENLRLQVEAAMLLILLH